MNPKESSKREKKKSKNTPRIQAWVRSPIPHAKNMGPSPCSLHGRLDAQCMGVMQCAHTMHWVYVIPSAPQWVYAQCPHELEMSRPSQACLVSYSMSIPTFTPHELGLSHPSLACLGPSNMLGPTFTSTRTDPNICQGIFPEPHVSPSIFYIDLIHIISSKIQLKISQG